VRENLDSSPVESDDAEKNKRPKTKNVRAWEGGEKREFTSRTNKGDDAAVPVD